MKFAGSLAITDGRNICQSAIAIADSAATAGVIPIYAAIVRAFSAITRGGIGPTCVDWRSRAAVNQASIVPASRCPDSSITNQEYREMLCGYNRFTCVFTILDVLELL